MFLDRLPTRASEAEQSTVASKLRAWETVLVLTLAAERIRECSEFGSWNVRVVQVALAVVLVLAYFAFRNSPVRRRIVLAGLAAVQLSAMVNNFPYTGNHLYLGFFLVGLAALFDLENAEERGALLSATRWLLVVVMFYAGVQKLVHGYYFRGEMLAYCVAFDEGFRSVLGMLMSGDDLARLSSYRPAADAGPFRVASLPFVAASNAAWLFEIVGAGLLLVPRWRLATVAAMTAFLVVTEVMARELFFGVLFVNTLLLFLPRDTNRRLGPLFGLFLLWLIAMKLGLVPAIRHT